MKHREWQMKPFRNFLLLLVTSAAVLAIATPAHSDDVIYFDGDSYAAIAYSPKTAKFGIGYNYGTRAAAEKEAMKQCEADDAKIVVWVHNGFCALALGDDKSVWGVGWSYGDGARTREAKSFALEECNKRTKNAEIHAVACSSDAMKPFIKK
ncbi:MAG TPA: DUF4189 domain-containing protein [Gemmataceae bacterium]|jgi:hypothetical protein|nr:DUF4189 domain-containing protein [Gemmataceae bacterium]